VEGHLDGKISPGAVCAVNPALLEGIINLSIIAAHDEFSPGDKNHFHAVLSPSKPLT
jgi:hypothetical protein